MLLRSLIILQLEKLEINYKMKCKRKYYRKCGCCGERHEQSEMIRTDNSPNGWICVDCQNKEHPEYEIDEW